MDLANRFPYLVPIWHSLSNQNLNSRSFNTIDPNFDIEVGGIGTFNNIHFKNYRRLPYIILRPMLPFFINENNRLHSKYTSLNCLAYCPKRKVLFSCPEKQIDVFDLDLRENYSHREDINLVTEHNFTKNQKTPVNPFHYDILNTWSHNRSGQALIDIKLCENNDELEVMTYSRTSLEINHYVDDSNQDSKLKAKVIINSHCKIFPSSDSYLNFLDRNQEFPEEFIVSFIDDNNLYSWNIEKNISTLETSIQIDSEENKHKLINIQYLKNFNPFLYIYGTHNNILLGDTRRNISGFKNASIPLVTANDFIFFKPFELFQTFVINPLEPHQFITISDFNVNFFDLRYPNKNVFQMKHMIDGQMVNKIVPARYPIHGASKESLILLISNIDKTCLLSFDCKLAIQPSMIHSPFYVESPFSINKLFPFESERKCFIKGMQVLVNDYNPGEEENIFDVAFLLNNGDIFMQDFRSTPKDFGERYNPELFQNDFQEFMYENHIGNKIYLNRDLDNVTKKYMNSIIDYLDETRMHQKANMENFLCWRFKFCPTCYGNEHLDYLRSNETFDRILFKVRVKKLKCLQNEIEFCQCLRSRDQLEEELSLIQSIDESHSRILSTEGCRVSNPDQKYFFTDNDQIDFEFIKQNWFLSENHSSNNVRQYCRPLTRKLFDLWCNEDSL